MQHIGIRYENERGDLLETIDANFADVFNAISTTSFSELEMKYPWTFSIDPYGDTTFGIKQWPHLVRELKALEEEMVDTKAKNVLQGLLNYFKKIEGKHHTFIKFVGD